MLPRSPTSSGLDRLEFLYTDILTILWFCCDDLHSPVIVALLHPVRTSLHIYSIERSAMGGHGIVLLLRPYAVVCVTQTLG